MRIAERQVSDNAYLCCAGCQKTSPCSRRRPACAAALRTQILTRKTRQRANKPGRIVRKQQTHPRYHRSLPPVLHLLLLAPCTWERSCKPGGVGGGGGYMGKRRRGSGISTCGLHRHSIQKTCRRNLLQICKNTWQQTLKDYKKSCGGRCAASACVAWLLQI